MTEEEAKTKWCAMVRFNLGGISFYSNREKTADSTTTASHCLGSNCMMWRWEQTNKNDGKGGFLNEKLPPGEWIGYCGLAGKP